ncbi:MAG: two-component system response regulator [Acidobacteria bacterium]|nr:MAG: two-component system response regulator [Acidobacteriota bacterium]
MAHRKTLFLLVEDFEDSRFMMRRLLEMAVTMALKEKPQLILMDLSLPKLDGLAATRKIREHRASAKIPIVAVSAHDSPQSRNEALAAGCNEYVTKPIDFEHLNSVVTRLLH